MAEKSNNPNRKQTPLQAAIEYQAARERQAQDVDQESAEAEASQRKRRKSAEEWMDLVGRRIEEAMREGQFDNLRNHGKPIELNRNPNVPGDMRMAYDLLENNELTPVWIADRKTMQERIAKLRRKIERIAAEYRAEWAEAGPDRPLVERRWRKQVEAWESEMVEINRSILTVNLSIPVARLELFALRLEEELRRAGAGRMLGR